MDTKTCPSPGQLTAFVLGTLDEPQITAIAEHLDLCSTCEQAVAGMEDLTDSVVEGLRRRSGEFPDPSSEPDLPEILGDYRLIRVLGRGGMGVVYEAEQIALGRRVALKVLPHQARLDPRLLSRFRREAQAAARLHHTHIVPVFGVGESDGVPFYVMQLIHGRGLDSVLRTRRSARKVGRDETVTHVAASDCLGEGRAYWKSVARLGLQVAEALDHAHGAGFLHRDIKPSNLLIDDRASVWVTDFGLVKELAEAADLTHSGAFLGTLRYAPPEALQGEKADARGDLYSLGITLYELATLRPAFEDNDRSRLMHRILHEDPTPPRQIEPTLPRDLETIILKTCSREPSRRYQTAAELGADLQRFLDDQPIRARPLGQWGQAMRWAKRNPAIAGLITTLLMVLTVGFAAVSALWLKAENASRHAESRRVEAEQSLDRSEANVYYSRISQADLNYQLGDVANSRLNLSQSVPPGGEVDRRDWEWDYLSSRLNAEIANFPGHRTWIFGLAPLADGRLVVAGGEPHFLNANEANPGDLRVWNTVDGKELARLATPGLYSISALAASPDGRRLATHDSGGASKRTSTLRLWDLDARKVAWQRQDLDILGGDGTFSPDGRSLLARDAGHTLLLDAASGSTLRTFPRARAARFTDSDGHPRITLLAAGSEVSVWDPETGKPAREPDRLPFPDSIEHADFSADGRWLAVLLQDATMAVWEVASGRRHLSLDDPGDSPSSCAFRPDSRAVAIGYRNGRVRVMDLFDGRGNEVYKGHEAVIQTLAFGPDGATLASGDWHGMVKVWDMTRSPESLSLYAMRRGLTASQTFTKIEDFAFLPGTDRVLGFRLPMAELAEWEASSGALVRRTRLDVATEGFIPGHLAEFSADGRACVALDRFEGNLKRFHTADGRPDGVFSGLAAMINRVALSRDGRRVAAVGWKSRHVSRPSSEVAVWDGNESAPTWLTPLDEELCGGLAISDDARRVAVASMVRRPGDNAKPFPTCRIRILDAATGRTLRTRDYSWYGGTTPSCPVAFDPGGRLLAFIVATQDGPRVGVWDVESGDERFLSETSGWPEALAFRPDGNRLATASHTLVTLWDTQTGRSVLRLPIRDANPGAAYNTRIRFSPDGKTLAATHSHGQLVTWRTDDASFEERSRAAQARRFGWHLAQAFASATPDHASPFAFHLKALERDATTPLQLAELHALDLRRGRFQAADARLDALEGTLPNDPQPWFDLGWSALERGDAPRALRGFAGAASATSQAESITIVHLTMLALMEGKDDLAFRAARRGAATWLRSGTTAERYPILVSTLASPGPLDVAPELPALTKTILTIARNHRPGEEELLQSLAHLRAGDTPEAERLARLALTKPLLPAFSPVAHATLALVLKARGDLAGARAELAKADAAHDRAHPKTQSHLGDGLYWLLSNALRREARRGL